ncbi:CDP-glycerol glycerophosphotransferase family protein [Microbacterium sp.]|uniref:CDP-glycerol glycerophosphotransferase family protein n=1 Tax=Microbacterium sp. TaxID=51671 RepID=UPI003735F8ED
MIRSPGSGVWAAPALRWAARRVRRGGSVTLLVTVTDDNAVLLPACLDAIGAQSRRPEEIVLLVLGSHPVTRRQVSVGVSASWRVRVADLSGTHPDAAWARGVDVSRGDYVLGVHAGDTLHPESVGRLAASLDSSGADVAVGGQPRAASGVGLDEAPWLVAGPRRETQMWRRSSVRPGTSSTWFSALDGVLAAARVDSLTVPVTVGPRRGTGEAFGTLPILAPYAEEWVAELGEIEQRLSPALRAAFRAWVLQVELPRWLCDAERCTPLQWSILAGEARRRWSSSSPAERAGVPAERRVRVWLAAQDRRADLEAYVAARFQEEGLLPTRAVDGRVLAEVPVPGVPESELELSLDETRLQLRVLRHRVVADELDLALAAWIPGVDSEGARAEVRLLGDGGVARPADVQVASDVELRRLSGARHVDHTHGLLIVSPPAEPVATEVEVAFTAGEITRTACVALARPVTAYGEIADVALDGSCLVVRLGHGAGSENGADFPRGSGTSPAAFPVGSASFPASPGKPTTPPGELATTLQGPVRVVGTTTWGEMRFRLRHEPWGDGERLIPAGRYTLDFGADEALAGRLPLTLRSEEYRARVEAAPGGLAVVLSAPHEDEEVGPVAQQRLQRWYAVTDLRLDPRAVYLQSYTGQAATDSPAAIHRELRRVRPDLRLRWGVADASVRVPEGGEPVLMHSREWYAALATSAHVVTNVDLERWFVKRPGQRVLQTFHGYPAKTMGLSAWHAKNFTPLRIERLLRRTSGTWDLLLTPTPEMDRLYREHYRYDGRIHSLGYPRDDVLVAPDAAEVRVDVRRRLGLTDDLGDRTAVLYAPTWRDDLATNHRAAPLVSPLDVDELAESLGEDYVVLLRGHRFHRRRPRRTAGSVLDVTDYPEINDLILAADAAVLDYSSLRFDFALTGRPMVFLVPDLDRYEAARGFLHDFRASAPGPLLDDPAEVAEALRDLPSLAATYADRVAAFNRTFNAHQDGHAAERVVRTFVTG